MVGPFTNSALVREPACVRESFEEEVETVEAFLGRTANKAREELEDEICRKVLRGLSDGKVGLYSEMQENA